jgi:hypothetical protein
MRFLITALLSLIGLVGWAQSPCDSLATELDRAARQVDAQRARIDTLDQRLFDAQALLARSKAENDELSYLLGEEKRLVQLLNEVNSKLRQELEALKTDTR